MNSTSETTIQPTFGDILRELTFKKEEQWSCIPESYRNDIRRDCMEEFHKGWIAFDVVKTKDALQKAASKGLCEHKFGFSPSYVGGRVLSNETNGTMRALTCWLAKERIAFKSEWQQGSHPLYEITAIWSKP